MYSPCVLFEPFPCRSSCSVNVIKTGIAVNGFTTEKSDVKLAISRAPVPLLPLTAGLCLLKILPCFKGTEALEEFYTIHFIFLSKLNFIYSTILLFSYSTKQY